MQNCMLDAEADTVATALAPFDEVMLVSKCLEEVSLSSEAHRTADRRLPTPQVASHSYSTLSGVSRTCGLSETFFPRGS